MNKISKFWIQWNLTNTDPMSNIESVFIYGVIVLESVVLTSWVSEMRGLLTRGRNLTWPKKTTIE